MRQTLRHLFDKPERIFLVLSSFFGLVSLFMMPVLTIPDEGAHFWLSYGMFSKNQKIPESLLVSPEESKEFVKDGTYIENIFQDKVDLEGDTLQFNFSKAQSGINASNDASPRPVSSLDIPRLPQAIGIALGELIYPSLGVMITMGRLFNLAFFIVAVFFIIKKVRFGKLALTFLALFPMIIHQAASLSHDVVNIVVIFAWVALMINLYLQKDTITKKQLLSVGLFAVALVITKPSNALLLAFLPFLPMVLYKNTKLFKVVSKKIPRFSIKKNLLWVAVGLVSVAVLVISAYLADLYLAKYGVSSTTFVGVLINTFFRTDINTQLDPIVTTGIVGHFGWLWYRFPEWLVYIHLAVFTLILLGDKVPKVNLKFALMSLCLFILSVLAITVGMYFLWTLQPSVAGINATFIQGMQGRYFTPLLALLIPVFAYLQNYIRIKISKKLLTIIAISMAALSLAFYLALTYSFFYLPK
jgi:uncharacterized membrane protein